MIMNIIITITITITNYQIRLLVTIVEPPFNHSELIACHSRITVTVVFFKKSFLFYSQQQVQTSRMPQLILDNSSGCHEKEMGSHQRKCQE